MKHGQQQMAQVEWADAIKTVSGALTKINKKSQHAGDQKMILATHRVAETSNPNCSRIYLRGLSSVSRDYKNKPLSSKERLNRTRFTAVKAMVAARKENLQTLSQDQMAFVAQKDTAGGKKTFNAYLWSVCGAEYDQQHG